MNITRHLERKIGPRSKWEPEILKLWMRLSSARLLFLHKTSRKQLTSGTTHFLTLQVIYVFNQNTL